MPRLHNTGQTRGSRAVQEMLLFGKGGYGAKGTIVCHSDRNFGNEYIPTHVVQERVWHTLFNF